MHVMCNAVYFARAVGYGAKMFMTLTPGGLDVHEWTISN